MTGNLRAILLSVFTVAGGALQAETCVPEFTVRQGDSIFLLAETLYGDSTQWPRILEANPALVGVNLAQLDAGMVLTIPCADQLAAPAPPPQITPVVPAAPQPIVPAVELPPVEKPVVKEPEIIAEPPKDKTLKLLTSAHYAPLTGQATSRHGLMADIVKAALERAPETLDVSVTWEENWATHLDPLLSTSEFDMGFPWPQPDCESDPTDPICEGFLFSEPLIEMPVGLFVRSDSIFRFIDNADILGKSICRPKGYSNYDLDSPDRRWIKDGKIDLILADSFEDCFEQVKQGKIDAVAVNLVVGAKLVLDLRLRHEILPLVMPIAQQKLYAVTSKDNPQGAHYISQLNAGLKALRASGSYQEILFQHVAAFTARLDAPD
ncbi:MAG: transporter substrate-binding domain-containing protein [Sulfitobacter sp.]